jgi:choice-of-anchor B domain-containing protein
LFVAAASTPILFAHEDDPKILDRRPRAFRGRGMPPATPSALQPAGGSGPQFLSFGSNGIRLLSWLSLQDLNGGDNGNSLWGYTSPSGREYACFGSQLGTHFVEVTDPANPVVIGFIGGPSSLWRDVRTYQNYAYAVSEGGGGIQVISLANIDSGVVTLVNTVTTGGSTTATHTVCINETSGYLYRAGGGGHGIRIYSLANPINPTYVSSWDNKYCHEVTVITYPSGPYAGKEVAFFCGGDNGGWANAGLFILDVTNKANLQLMSSLNYAGAQYSHQAWPSADLQTLYLDDELDEYYGLTTCVTKVFDISNLNAPVQKPDFGNGNTAIGHNLYTKGNLLYQANYTSGLRIFDVTTPWVGTEVAYFDTYPENDGNTFNSLWNVYPYFQSGTVIGSDIDRGLFVWWIGAPRVALAPASTPSSISVTGEKIDVTLTELNAGDYQPGTAELNVYTETGGWQSQSLVSLGGSSFRADFPTFTCGESVQWYLSAESPNGMTWTEPAGAPGVTWVSSACDTTASVASYDFESSSGWTVGFAGDTASQGVWLRGAPNSTTSAQPRDDHTDNTFQCFYTGDGQDVDGGKTTLVSPAWNLSAVQNPHVRYWRWFSNETGGSPGTDTFKVEISNNNGLSWSLVETVGPTGVHAQGGWYLHQFRIASIVTPTSQVKLRFVAEDAGSDSEIECGVDDVEVFSVDCTAPTQVYCTGKTNSQGCVAAISSSGTASASGATGVFSIQASNVLNQKAGTLFYGFDPSAAPFQGGFKCVASPVVRTGLLNSGGSTSGNDCTGTFAFDFNAYILTGFDPNLIVGATVFCQYWYRDGADPFGTSLTNALQFGIDY